MSIDLSKGSRVDLTKGNANLKRIKVGLGWAENITVGADFDLDASVFICGANGKRISDAHFVYYKNLVSPGGFVTHSGDNLTGNAVGDDETITVDLTKSHNDVDSLIFVVTIHEAKERNQNFGQVRDAYIRLVDADTNVEIMKYDLSEDFSIETGVTFGRIYKKDGEFRFEAVGAGFQGGLAEYLKIY